MTNDDLIAKGKAIVASGVHNPEPTLDRQSPEWRAWFTDERGHADDRD